MEYELIYIVVNKNSKTINPATGKLYDGPYCQSNGYQVNRVSQAKIYSSKQHAEKLARNLNMNGPEGKTPDWAIVQKNKWDCKGEYVVVEKVICPLYVLTDHGSASTVIF